VSFRNPAKVRTLINSKSYRHTNLNKYFETGHISDLSHGSGLIFPEASCRRSVERCTVPAGRHKTHAIDAFHGGGEEQDTLLHIHPKTDLAFAGPWKWLDEESRYAPIHSACDTREKCQCRGVATFEHARISKPHSRILGSKLCAEGALFILEHLCSMKILRAKSSKTEGESRRQSVETW
jgi:hypothetical protein